METDYEKMGFKCGLEIHQQIEGRKLFCNCVPKDVSDTDLRIERKLRAVAGESGETDVAARFEMAKDRKFLYVANLKSTCLVEYDEEPPRPISMDALNTSLIVAMLLNAKIVDEIHVMRKIVIDGSNVSGFQRTALIAANGYVETSKGKVSVPTICLEEEAAQKVEAKEEYVKYNLDRLGIPLIEIATGTEIKDGQHAKETAAAIGMILRSTEKVVRGIGSIRQDVNISIKGGARTEIKGFQDLRAIPKVIEFEVKRQQELIVKGEKVKEEVRKAEPDFTTSFLRPMPGSARLYPETDIIPIRITEEIIEEVKKHLPKLIVEKVENIEKKYGLSAELAKEIISDNKEDVFEILVDKFHKIEPKFIAHVLINVPKDIKSRYRLESENISLKDIEKVLGYLSDDKIPREAVLEILVNVARGEEVDLSRYEQISDIELEGTIRDLIFEKRGLSLSAYMGIVMGKYRGKVEGKKVSELLKKYIRE